MPTLSVQLPFALTWLVGEGFPATLSLRSSLAGRRRFSLELGVHAVEFYLSC